MPSITAYNLHSGPLTVPGGFYPNVIQPNQSAEFDVPDLDEFLGDTRVVAEVAAGRLRFEYGGKGTAFYTGLVSYGGGAASTTATVTGIAATDLVLATLNASTNAVYVEKAVRTAANTVTITFSADPGASTTVALVVFRP